MAIRDKALESLRRFVTTNPLEISRVAVIAVRLESDAELLFDKLVPIMAVPDKDFFSTRLLLYALAQNNMELAATSWSRLSDEALDPNIVNEYILKLIKNKQQEDAIRAWRRFDDSEASFERVFNGGFEKAFAQTGLGWVETGNVKGVDVSRDQAIAIEGNASLKITFDGTENVNFTHVRQYIPVEPGARYELRGQWRGSKVTTRSNLYIKVNSVGVKDNVSARSGAKRSNWNWEPFYFQFTVPDGALFIVARIRRDKTDALDKRISGKIWLDDLKLMVIGRPD